MMERDGDREGNRRHTRQQERVGRGKGDGSPPGRRGMEETPMGWVRGNGGEMRRGEMVVE